MRKITKKTAVIIAGSTLLVAVGGGVAFAYWSSTGNGTGTATTGTSTSNLAVTESSSVPSGLAPGVAPVPVNGTITNNGTNSVYVNTLTIAVGTVTGNPGACTNVDYGLTTGTAVLDNNAPHSITVNVHTDLAPGAHVSFPTANIGFADNPNLDQSGCEGATPQLTFTTS